MIQVLEHPCWNCPDRLPDGYCLMRVSHIPLSCDRLTAWTEAVPMDIMVEAIRSDRLVGRGTGSCIDEGMDRAHIIGALAVEGVYDAAGAVGWARKENIRQVKAWAAWSELQETDE
jgi:hypothetical protein